MDIEKLDMAAIIAAARYDNPFDEPAYDKKFYDVFKAGTDWLMQQPLSERLTEEEKEKIKAIYFRNVYSVADVQSNFTEKCLIDALFGADLFKDK